MMLHSLTWFLIAFGITLGALALLRYRLSLYDKRMELKNIIQEISQEVALGYFQHGYNKLCELPSSSNFKSEIEVLKAQCLLGLGRREELLDFLKRTLEHHSQNHTARRMFAKLLAQSGQAQMALQQFKLLEGKLLEEDLLSYASALYQAGDWAGCQSLIEEHSKQPNGQILSILADALFKQQQWALATDYYQKSENLGWRPLGLVCHNAQCLMALGRLAEAEPCLREWLRAQPRNAKAGAFLASCLERQDRVQESLQILEAFEDDLEEDALGYATLGRCYFRLKEYPKATHYLLNAYEYGDENPSNLALIGISFEKQQQWVHAEKIYAQLIAGFEDHFAGYVGMAYLFAIGQLRELGPQRGLEYALRAVELQPSVASWEVLSACYARCTMFEKAHQIQENLMKYALDEAAISRRQEAMRKLRQHKPLTGHLIPRSEVA